MSSGATSIKDCKGLLENRRKPPRLGDDGVGGDNDDGHEEASRGAGYTEMGGLIVDDALLFTSWRSMAAMATVPS